MMKQKKRRTSIVSLALTLAMLFATLPATAFAQENGLANVYIDGAGWNELSGEGYYNGDDTNEGNTPQKPVQSFLKARLWSPPSGTIWCISPNVVADTQV